MTFKFGNKISNHHFKFGNKIKSNTQMTFGNKVNSHGKAPNGFDLDTADYYTNSGQPNYKPKQSDLEKRHEQLIDNHHKHM